MSTVGLVTAVYDGYDSLKPFVPQEGVDIDAVCVTDDPDLECDGWRIVHEPRPGVHPNRAAKRPKMLPWRYTDAHRSIWIDASFEVRSPLFACEAVHHVDGHSPIAQFVHPWRSCLFDEADLSVTLAKYDGEPIREQADFYRRAGHPEQWGLWATGVIVRAHSPVVEKFGNLWLAECNTWSFQDQVSEPYALFRTSLRPELLPGDHLTNPWLAFAASGRH